MKIRYPIRYKFLFFTTLLLVFCVVAYLILASSIFKNDKIELVYDLNRSAVTGVSADVSTQFQGTSDKIKLVAVLSQESRKQAQAALEDLLHDDGSIVFIAASYGFKGLDHVFYMDKDFASTYGVDESFFTQALVQERAVPYSDVRSFGEAVWNATAPNGPPLIGYGKSVVIESPGGAKSQEIAPFGIVAFMRADKMLTSFSSARLNEVIVVNDKGQTLIHPTAGEMASARSYADHPLFKLAQSQQVKTGVSSFTHQGKDILGAYSAAFNRKIFVLSQVDGSHVFSAVEQLVRRSLIFAMIAITLAFIAAVFFSRSLTRPIQALTEAMKKVSEGELSVKIDLTTNDETALLAGSFNSMIRDLKASREQLEEINRELEQKVKDRTRKLEEQNVAVKRAQEALLQSTRLAAVGEVAGRAAHEVLNPLTSIVTRLEKVRSRLQQGPVQEVALVHDIFEGWRNDVSAGGFEKLVRNWSAPSGVDAAVTLWQEDIDNVAHFEANIKREIQDLIQDTDFLIKESNRINKIVQNMRSLTRVRGDAKTQRASLLMRDAVNIMADLCLQEDIEIRQELTASDDRIHVDGDEFIQVATNLLRNSIQAIQARPQGCGRGLITVTISDHEGSVCIDLQDNGVGISDENSSKLFEVQFTTKSPEEGTGIGLSISRRFIRAFGGDITLLHTAPGKGCAFRIVLPSTQEFEMQKVAV